MSMLDLKQCVLILRGPSGSGKSRFVAEHADGDRCSMDDLRYVETPDGPKYVYDPRDNGRLAQQCQVRFLGLLSAVTSTVVVDNTHIRAWEFEMYARLAREHRYRVVVVEFVTDSLEVCQRLAARNKHGVPLETIYRQAAEFEPLETSELCEEGLIDGRVTFCMLPATDGGIRYEGGELVRYPQR
jgi:predicted kinase